MSELIDIGRRERCGLCGWVELIGIVDLGASPIANTFRATVEESLAMPRYPLGMVRCSRCQLAQISHVIPDDLIWGDDFGYYSSTSAPLLRHFSEYASWAMLNGIAKPGRLVIEVGCNDGILLRHFAEAGYPTLGIDPAKGPAAAAQALGLNVIVAGLTREVAAHVVDMPGPAALVLANNVGAHVVDLPGFLASLRDLMAHDGLLVMEVQDFDELMLGHGFDMIYHEHRYFYSLSTLVEALASVGLAIEEVHPVATQGGSIRIVAARNSATRPNWSSQANVTRLHINAQYRADAIRIKLNRLLGGLKSQGLRIAAYGAPAKAATLLHWTGAYRYLDWVADTTPAKIGRYLPGTALPVVDAATSEAPDVYLLTAWNYASAILRKESQFLASGGRFVIPLPVPVVI